MGIIEGEYDDRPLPGPWNRREGGYPGPVARVPGPVNEGAIGSEGKDDDLPLPGPWDRRPVPVPPDPGPPEESPRTGEDADYDAAPPDHREPEPFPGRAEEPGEMPDTAGLEESRAACEKQVPGRCRRPGGYIRKIFSPAGIYAGVIMAEVLGPRGGKLGRQSPVIRRRP
ncbi:MAG: hypothetical protein K6T66_01285 [Peptococcaceae bacterium]|nr:hypothetical protein [Peptococcaceae bacterium]